MSCKNCEERRKLAREALLRSAVGETIIHIAKGAAEMAGLKKKTAIAEKKAVAKRKSGATGKKTVPVNTEQEQD